MTSSESKTEDVALQDCLLTELRRTILQLRTLQADAESIECAVKHRLLAPEEAMRLAFDRDLLPWLFDRKGSA